MNIFGTDLASDLKALREHWAEIDANNKWEIQCPVCQRGEPCAENLKLTLEAENALLKKKLEIAMAGLDEYADGHRWSSRTGKVSQGLVYDVFFPDCGGDHGYELARKIKAEIEEVK